MHPDEAVQIAIQDLRSPGRYAPPPMRRAAAPSLASRLVHAYVQALRWYVQDGRTPVADQGSAVGHLPRVRFSIDAPRPAVDAALVPVCAEGAR